MEGATLTTLRVFITSVIALGSAWFVYQACYLPFQCNRITATVQNETAALVRRFGDPFANSLPLNAPAAADTRKRIRQLQVCLESNANDPHLYMNAAANYLLLQQRDAAEQMYQEAMLIDQRPEILFNLGVLQAFDGRREAARKHLVKACTFAPYMIPEIRPADLQQEVAVAVKAHAERMRQTKR